MQPAPRMMMAPTTNRADVPVMVEKDSSGEWMAAMRVEKRQGKKRYAAPDGLSRRASSA